MALGTPVEAGRFGPLAESAMMECGNIVGSFFVSALAKLVGAAIAAGDFDGDGYGDLLYAEPHNLVLARGSGKACVDRLVDHAGSIALATRFTSP